MANSDEIKSAWHDLGRKLAQLRKAAGYTQHAFARLVQYGRSSVANTETGHQQPDRTFWARCDEILQTGGVLVNEYDSIAARARQQRRASAMQATTGSQPIISQAGATTNRRGDYDEDGVRRRLESALGQHELANSSLDDWEQTVVTHARATRYRPADELLTDLLADIVDLQLLFSKRHTAMSLCRTTRLTAQMAGLISLTLLKLNAIPSSLKWARTARVAAAETADPATSSWVWAQDAYRHFYVGDHARAITVARHAQQLAGRSAGVGAALAAALEARAYAATGRSTETKHAIGVAEAVLSHLAPDQTVASAFGYDEAQLRFHAGNAYTHLGDTAAAWIAQERALQLYPANDYLDRSLIALDRAACLLRNHDPRAGAQQLVDVLINLKPDQRAGLLLARVRDILDTVPDHQKATGALQDIYDLLPLTLDHHRAKRTPTPFMQHSTVNRDEELTHD